MEKEQSNLANGQVVGDLEGAGNRVDNPENKVLTSNRGSADHEPSEVELLRRENELLKREKELARREAEVARASQDAQRPHATKSEATTSNEGSADHGPSEIELLRRENELLKREKELARRQAEVARASQDAQRTHATESEATTSNEGSADQGLSEVELLRRENELLKRKKELARREAEVPRASQDAQQPDASSEKMFNTVMEELMKRLKVADLDEVREKNRVDIPSTANEGSDDHRLSSVTRDVEKLLRELDDSRSKNESMKRELEKAHREVEVARASQDEQRSLARSQMTSVLPYERLENQQAPLHSPGLYDFMGASCRNLTMSQPRGLDALPFYSMTGFPQYSYGAPCSSSVTSSSPRCSTPQQRGTRIRYTDQQLDVLNARFAQQQNLSRSEAAEIAAEIGVTPTQVQTRFKNLRYRSKH